MSHTESQAEVHVGDIGTTYYVRVFDAYLPFDPTSASVKQIRFKLPGGVVLDKTATVVPEGSPIATSWLLAYTVTAGSGAGSPAGEFHATQGVFRMQARLDWANGTTYRSNIVTHDDGSQHEDGVPRELRIYKNLS